ncbi:MAG: hypothetical protein R3B09_09680, partial [Nannocystaceae bacterium]
MTRYDQMIAAVRVPPREVPLGGGFRAAYWGGPRTFDAESQRAIYAAIIEMASAVFGDDMTPYWRRRAEEGYLDTISKLYIVGDPAGELVGWTGYHRMRISGETCIYTDATGVLARVRRYGLMRRILTRCVLEELARNRLRPVYWTMRTESPVVMHSFRTTFGEANVFPRIDADTPLKVRELGRATAAWLKQEEKFCPASMRLEDAFDGPCPWRFGADGQPLAGSHPESSDEALDRFVAAQLRPEDAFILIARHSIANVLRLTSQALRSRLRARLG